MSEGDGGDPVARAGPVFARLDQPRAQETTIAVVADPHLAVGRSGTWKCHEHTVERFERALRDAADRGADGVLLAGDLTRDGTRAEFRRVDALLDGLGVAWAAIPGNHDVPKSFDDHPGIGTAAFEARYTPDGLPFRLQVGGVDLLGLNTASLPDGSLSSTWAGALSVDQRDWLAGAVRDRPTVAVLHHNLGPLPEHTEGYPWDRFPLRDGPAVRGALADAGVSLAVTAHHHVPAARRLGGLAELMAPATCSFPPGYLLLRVTLGGTTARLVPLAGPERTEDSYRRLFTDKPWVEGIAALATDRLGRLPLL